MLGIIEAPCHEMYYESSTGECGLSTEKRAVVKWHSGEAVFAPDLLEWFLGP